MAASMAPDDYCHHLPPACAGHRATPAVTRWKAARAADVAGSPGAGGMADTRHTTFLSSSVHQKPPATMGGVRTCHGAKCRHLVNPAQGTHPQRRLSPGHTTFPHHGHDTATGTTPPCPQTAPPRDVWWGSSTPQLPPALAKAPHPAGAPPWPWPPGLAPGCAGGSHQSRGQVGPPPMGSLAARPRLALLAGGGGRGLRPSRRTRGFTHHTPHSAGGSRGGTVT